MRSAYPLVIVRDYDFWKRKWLIIFTAHRSRSEQRSIVLPLQCTRSRTAKGTPTILHNLNHNSRNALVAAYYDILLILILCISLTRQTLFPLGHLPKQQVKAIARDSGLERVADKRESMGICFVGKRKRFADFLGESSGCHASIIETVEFWRCIYVGLAEYIDQPPGPAVTPEGKVIGQHKGLFAYTIGQASHIYNGTERWVHASFNICNSFDKWKQSAWIFLLKSLAKFSLWSFWSALRHHLNSQMVRPTQGFCNQHARRRFRNVSTFLITPFIHTCSCFLY